MHSRQFKERWKYNFWELSKDVCKLWKFSKEGKEYLIPLWHVCIKEFESEEINCQKFIITIKR